MRTEIAGFVKGMDLFDIRDEELQCFIWESCIQTH